MERREVRLCVWSASGTRFGDNVFFCLCDERSGKGARGFGDPRFCVKQKTRPNKGSSRFHRTLCVSRCLMSHISSQSGTRTCNRDTGIYSFLFLEETDYRKYSTMPYFPRGETGTKQLTSALFEIKTANQVRKEARPTNSHHPGR